MSTSTLAYRSTTSAPAVSRLALIADLPGDEPMHTRRIHTPRVAKRAFSRTTAEAFDPSKVSSTLSPRNNA